jgi:hypothetical protein
MKRLAPYALMLLFISTASTGFSQTAGNPKPKQFDNYPAVINCTEAELAKVFGSPAGQRISFAFSDNFNFAGDITSNIVKYNNLQSAIVRSPDFHNTIFSISKLTNKDNSITYVGHIVNRDYFDGYDLKRDAAGNYKLIKIEMSRVMPDCTQ